MVIKCKELHLIYQDTGSHLKQSCCGTAKKLDTVGRRGQAKNDDSTEDIETDFRAQWEVD